jgi:hypothetical protein
MGTPLNVMVLESHPGVAQHAADQLGSAGHRVHRCHEPADKGFPCSGVASPADCPLEQRIDVALVVRRGVAPRPTPLEDGVACAIRAGVPVVEHGADVLDPYTPFLAARVGGTATEVVTACEDVAGDALEATEGEVSIALQQFLRANDLDPEAVRVRLEHLDDSLHIHLEGADLDQRLRGLLGVKAVDACRRRTRRCRSVDVSFHTSS